MKKILYIAICLFSVAGYSQSKDSLNSPREFVQDFFKAFHAQDTVKLKSFAAEGMKLQSVSLDTEGNTKITSEDFSQFIKSIASIPADASFEEKLHAFRIEQNGLLATVTTPYSFYYNGNFSHCGVNSFQLVCFSGEWKIVYLIDTRTKEDCN